MTDRSSARIRRPTRPRRGRSQIGRLRRLRFTSTRIAAALRMPVSTVCAVLQRIGLNRLSKLEPPEPPNRYCRRHAGELVHVDVKKLGRFNKPARAWRRGPGVTPRAGWEAVHVCVDDATRLAYVEVLPDERAVTTVGFLDGRRLVRRRTASTVQRGHERQRLALPSPSSGRPSADHGDLEHIRTRPYRPRTNGKAERFIQTMLREWAYAAAYRNSTTDTKHSGPGSTTTTTNAHTAPSATTHPPAGSPPMTTSGLASCRYWLRNAMACCHASAASSLRWAGRLSSCTNPWSAPS